MKKILLLLLVIPFIGFSQVGKKEVVDIKWTQVGKLTNPYKFVELEYKEYDGERTYKLSFQNMEYMEIVDIGTITFTASQEDIEYIRQTLIDGCLLKKNAEAITLEIGQGTLLIRPMSGKNNVRMYYDEKGKTLKHTWFTKKQIDKVFKG